eukprot:TRINITY_DN1180_c0_g1_i1.p1 TRINITY_DN1180_c0_g1~~TRINITY_DN1180_c0_g1_i1.p1  ORF type:complete len:358 (+),score=56.10 TRINITY_DN1180_c0_g1_i1:291-1364(+)
MLTYDPKMRIKPEQALAHPFFKRSSSVDRPKNFQPTITGEQNHQLLMGQPSLTDMLVSPLKAQVEVKMETSSPENKQPFKLLIRPQVPFPARVSETESQEENDTSPGVVVNQRPTSGPSAFPIHPTHNFLHPVPPSHHLANSGSQPIFLNFPVATSVAQSQTYDPPQHQLLVQTGSAAGDLQPAVYQFRAMPGQVAPTKLMRLSTSTSNIHSLSQTRSSLKPANRTKSLSTNDSSMINQTTQLSQQNVCVQEPVTIDPSLHKKLDKTTSLPIYAHQATLPVGTTITALPGYVYAPAPTTVQLTPFYQTVPGPFIHPANTYGISTVSPMKPGLNSKRHKTSTNAGDEMSQKQALGPIA